MSIALQMEALARLNQRYIAGFLQPASRRKSLHSWEATTARPRETARSARTLHATHTAHHIGQLATLHLLHHFLHLFVLLEQSIQVLNLGARALCDPALAGTVQDVRIDALAHRHRVDDGFHLTKLGIVDVLGSTGW